MDGKVSNDPMRISIEISIEPMEISMGRRGGGGGSPSPRHAPKGRLGGFVPIDGMG